MRSRSVRWVAAAFAVLTLAACANDSNSGGTTSSAAAGSSAASSAASTASSSGGSASSPAGSASSSSGGASAAITEGLRIAILPKQINNAYFDAAFAGATKACGEIAAECEQVGPTEASGAAQAEFINTEIQKQYDALVISAADANAVAPALQQAKAAGIAVVTYDADVDDPTARMAMIQPTTPELIGESIGQAGSPRQSVPTGARSPSSRPPLPQRTRTPGSS